MAALSFDYVGPGAAAGSRSGPGDDKGRRDERDADHDVIIPARHRLPAAAAPAQHPCDAARGSHVASLYLLTLLSAVDGSLLLLAAGGTFDTLGGSVLVGLLVVAGAGSWLAAHNAFAGRAKSVRDWTLLGLLGLATFTATLASAWLGLTIGQAITLHVLPKAVGVVLVLVAGEVAGLRVRVARVPAPVVAIGAAALLEVALRWTP